ncbi:MAG: thioredoxin family protein [Hyphomicrobiaceae bacterium]|nr:thioredoxin family protein [Hyphomicrobiaceae bacterium]
MLQRLRESLPHYNKAVTFVLVDWDTFKSHEVTTSRKIPRRSTFVLIKGGKEIDRLVAETAEERIKAMLDLAVK